MTLADYTTDQLLAEIKRRADEEELGRQIDQWCEGCAHWRYSERESDRKPNCTKLHSMSFRMPVEHPDSEPWGFYRLNCPDWAERPADAPGPKYEIASEPAAQRAPPRRRAQPAHHADAITTEAPKGSSPMLNPMHVRPRPGQRFAVHTRAGLIRHACRATHIVGAGIDAIVIYHGKYALDEGDAIGWWPEPRR